MSQYWKACTKVIERIPPSTTVATTTTAAAVAPTHGGQPVIVVRVSPAPCSCGSRYSQPMTTTNAVQILRSVVEPSRASAKSGTV